MAADFEITVPTTEQDLQAAYRLRWERLRKPHGQPEGSEREPRIEDLSTQVVAKVGDRVVGAAVWIGLPGPGGLRVRMRQIAIDPEFEGTGIGRAIIEHIEAEARALGASELHASVREERVSYFLERGWVAVGEDVTRFGNVRHVSMAVQLI